MSIWELNLGTHELENGSETETVKNSNALLSSFIIMQRMQQNVK